MNSPGPWQTIICGVVTRGSVGRHHTLHLLTSTAFVHICHMQKRVCPQASQFDEVEVGYGIHLELTCCALALMSYYIIFMYPGQPELRVISNNHNDTNNTNNTNDTNNTDTTTTTATTTTTTTNDNDSNNDDMYIYIYIYIYICRQHSPFGFFRAGVSNQFFQRGV